jgi:hypothetical protein
MVEIDFNKLREVEASFDLSALKINQDWFYPALRHTIFNFKNSKTQISHSKKEKRKIGAQAIFRLLNIKLYMPVRKCEIVFFTGAGYRRMSVNGKKYNPHVDMYIDVLRGANVGAIEAPNSNYPFHHKNNYTNKLWFEDRFVWFTYLKAKIFKPDIDFQREVFIDFFNRLEIPFNEKLVLNQYRKFHFFKEYYFQLIKELEPKVVFVVCSYTLKYMALMKVCKKLGVRTIEIQHGNIHKNHPGYIYKEVSSNDYFPDELFAYGSQFKDLLLNKSKLWEKSKIKLIGNAVLESLFKHTQALNFNVLKGKKIIGISSQGAVNKYLIPFVQQLLEILPEEYHIVYKLHPDEYHQKNWYAPLSISKNISLIDNNDITVYEVLKTSFVHTTVFSTTLYEASFFGLPNILIKMKGFSESVEHINHNSLQFVSTPKEYIKVLEFLSNKDEGILFKDAKDFASSYYKENATDNFMEELKELL